MQIGDGVRTHYTLHTALCSLACTSTSTTVRTDQHMSLRSSASPAASLASAAWAVAASPKLMAL